MRWLSTVLLGFISQCHGFQFIPKTSNGKTPFHLMCSSTKFCARTSTSAPRFFLHRSRKLLSQSCLMSFNPDEDANELDDCRNNGISNLTIGGSSVAIAVVAVVLMKLFGHSPSMNLPIESIGHLVSLWKPAEMLQDAVTAIQSQGAMGYVYFGILYTVAEILVVPAIPLTASSGYLFGLAGGTAIVLFSATIAASISFLLGRTFFRTRIMNFLRENPKFKAVDAAIGKDGFRIVFLLRLSPLFPFALSNYLYGVTSVPFWEYVTASLLGMLPGTLAYVYGGGQVASAVDGSGLPWYALSFALIAVLFVFKTIGDIATKMMEEIEPAFKDQ